MATKRTTSTRKTGKGKNSIPKLQRLYVIEYDGIAKPGDKGHHERGAEVTERQLLAEGFDVARLEQSGAIVHKDSVLNE